MYGFFSEYKDDWLVNFPNTYKNVFDTPCTKIKNETFMKYIEDHWNTSIVFEASNIPNACDVFMKDFVQNCSDFEIHYEFSDGETQNIDCDNETTFLAVSSYYWEFWRFLKDDDSKETVLPMQNAIKEIERICNSPNTNATVTDCFEVTYIFHILTTGYRIKVILFAYYIPVLLTLSFIRNLHLTVSNTNPLLIGLWDI